MQKKKILYVITKSNFGGAQHYVYDLATSLPKEQFGVAVVLGGEGLLKEKLDSQRVRTITVPYFGRDIHIWNDVKTFFALIKIFKKEKPDIVHVNSSKMGGLGSLAARITRVRRIIFTVHGLPSQEPRFRRVRPLIVFLSWLSCFLSHAIISISREDFQTMQHWLGLSRKIYLINNGVKQYMPLQRDRARENITTRVHVPPSDIPWIGTIAELHPNKGLVYLLQGFKDVKNKARLFIIGNGEEEKKMEQYIQKQGLRDSVFLMGFVENAEKLLPAFDIFVLPSLKEGLPYVLLEAGMAGLPIVATNIGGIPDAIEDKKSGILVPPKNSSALKDALMLLTNEKSLREQYAKEIFKKIKEEFSFEKMFEKTTALYK